MDTQPSTHYHSAAVKEFKRQAQGQERIDLSEAALLAAARLETGLDRFGNDDFLPAMRALLGAVESEADLNAFGRHIVKSRTLSALRNRLWADACFAAHPEIRNRRIAAPIVIIGPHRSGTTRLHSMMATDTRLRHLKTWEGINPAPRLAQPDGGREARYEEVRQNLEARAAIYPGTYLAHPMHADWPEEEMLLLNQSFCGFSPLGLYNVPSYYRWFLAADKTAGYRYMADLMKLLAWSNREPQDTRWVLKNPQHMLDLDVLMNVFPDAKLVFIHRDPIKTVGSTLSLMWHYAVQHTDAPCRAGMRDIWLDFCVQAERRAMQMRKTIPAAQQIDIQYADMNGDWQGVMRQIYAFAGMDFVPTAEQAMANWLDRGKQEKTHGNHRYALEDFGTTPAAIDDLLMFARNRYGIAYEGRPHEESS